MARFFFVVMPAQAMKFMLHDNRLYAASLVVSSDATEFSIAFDNLRIDTVELVNSPGGVPESQCKPQTIEFCRDAQMLTSSCTAYPKVSAFSMGVVIDNALEDVALPRSFLMRSHYLALDWNALIFELI